jgi:Polyketide cyclase / dehydrase and lipid transport
MEVDVQTAIEIDRERAVVAAYASDPDNATTWYANIKSVEWRSAKPLRVGARIAFIAHFLGRTIDYTYEIKGFEPGERLVMATSEGPFAMETTYAWSDTPNGGTKMILRNRGAPSGFSKVAAPMMKAAMRRANSKDLARLKQILEHDSAKA